MIRKKNDALLSQLPEREARFVIDEGLQVIKRSDPTSLESVLTEVGAVLNKRSYGWEEAILDGRWYRYPSEIKDQVFCSEQALKNYLILGALGIPSFYLVAEKWTRNMAHETLVIPQKGGRLLGLDWGEVYPVKIEGEKLIDEETGKVMSPKIHIINQGEVLRRVKGLRDGSRFLDAISCGQQLYRKETDDGALEAFVEYNPENQRVSFEWEWIDFSTMIPTYFVHRMQVKNGSLVQNQELGIKERCCKKRPMLILDKDRKFRNKATGIGSFRFFYDRLEERTKEDLLSAVLYEQFLADHPERDLALYPEERAQVLEAMNAIKDDPSAEKSLKKEAEAYIEIYDSMKRGISDRAAERYADLRSFSLELINIYGDAQKAFGEHIPGKLPHNAEMCYLILNIKGLGRALSAPRTLSCQDRLAETLAKRTGVPYFMPEPNRLVHLMKEFGSKSREDF